MSSRSKSLRSADRIGLAALCLLLALSVSVRLHTYAAGGTASGGVGGAIDLGDGVSLPRDRAARRLVWTGTCAAPVTVDFVEPSPHGNDTSLAVTADPRDQVFYVYAGWTFGDRHAAMKLSMLYVLRQAIAIVRIDAPGTRGERAVKLVVPAGCQATPDDVMDALRRDVRAWG